MWILSGGIHMSGTPCSIVGIPTQWCGYCLELYSWLHLCKACCTTIWLLPHVLNTWALDWRSLKYIYIRNNKIGSRLNLFLATIILQWFPRAELSMLFFPLQNQLFKRWLASNHIPVFFSWNIVAYKNNSKTVSVLLPN